MRQRRFTSPAGRAAVGGILAAGSLAVLWLACLVPSGQLGVTAAAGLFPVGAVLAAGRGAGALCWAAASLLGLLLLPDKGVALMYLLFLGLYPVLKSRLEQSRHLAAEWAGKLLVFNAALTVLALLFRELFLPALPPWLGERGMAVLYGAGNLVFVLYDVALSRLIGGLSARLGLRQRR